MSIKISIVIPVFNSEDYLNETLQSVFNQSYTNWECFVIDDGSTDSSSNISQAWINSCSQISYHQRPKNMPKGANACRNYGAKISSGELLLFLDADDILHTECLKFRVKSFKNTNYDVIFFRMKSFQNENELSLFRLTKLTFTPLSPQSALQSFLNYNILWNTMGGLWKRNYFEKIGGFKENLMRFQDYEFHLRVLSSFEESSILIYPYDFYDCFYRISNFHRTINRFKKDLIYNSLQILLSEAKFNFGPGFYKYLIKNYSDYFLFDRKNIPSDLNRCDFIKHRILRVFKFDLLIYRIIGKILYYK
uniref:glycosyltransferase family 2 protein n=1 Tax=Algoriphagus sp. TaxID=1872435 RepID=UPI004047FB7E